MYWNLFVYFSLITGVLGKHPKPIRTINNPHHTQADHRIIGGSTSVEHSWPYLASLQYHTGYHFCGGALVTDKWILTAAHCVDMFQPDGFRVVMGEHSLNHQKGTEQYRNVTKINIHPFFNLQLNDFNFYLPHDLALIEVDHPFTLNVYVREVSLPSACSTFDGQICTIIGWGKSHDHVATEHLQEADVSVITTSDCRHTWGDFVYHGSLCVYSHLSTACQGDSGGPVMCLGQNSYQLAGISSWGDVECGQFPSIYSRVSDHLGWIQDITGRYY